MSRRLSPCHDPTLFCPKIRKKVRNMISLDGLSLVIRCRYCSRRAETEAEDPVSGRNGAFRHVVGGSMPCSPSGGVPSAVPAMIFFVHVSSLSALFRHAGVKGVHFGRPADSVQPESRFGVPAVFDADGFRFDGSFCEGIGRCGVCGCKNGSGRTTAGPVFILSEAVRYQMMTRSSSGMNIAPSVIPNAS